MLKVYASHLACLYFQKTCDALEVVVWTFIFRCIIFSHRWHTYHDTDLVIICPVNGWCAIVIQCMSTDLAENEFHNITCKHFAVHSLFCIWQFSSYKVCNTRGKKNVNVQAGFTFKHLSLLWIVAYLAAQRNNSSHTIIYQLTPQFLAERFHLLHRSAMQRLCLLFVLSSAIL